MSEANPPDERAPRTPRPALFAQVPEHGHVVIEASAGTGKTWTIERLVVDLLLRTGCTIDQVLVVTFTVRATHELKIRIRETIEGLLALETGVAHGTDVTPPASPEDESLLDNGDDASAGDWVIDEDGRACLQRALAQFDTASIHTIHAFCQKVLRDHAFTCGHTLEQTVVDPRQAFSRAFRLALRRELARADALRGLLGHWLSHRSVAQLEDVLFRYHRQQGEFRPRIEPGRLEEMSEAAWALRDLVIQPGVRDRIVAAYEAADIHRGDLEKIREMLPLVLETLAAFDDTRWGDLVSALDDVELELLHSPAPDWNASFPGGFPATLSGEAARFARGVEALQPALIPLDAAAIQWFLPTVKRTLEALKAREGWLDHDDMLFGVRDALRSERGGALARALRDRYRFALIDEFQDTDMVGWEIFQRIFVDHDPDGRRHRLFIIGDPKQAIYSFRGGDVATYLRARDALGRTSDRPPLRLRDNYRATPEMLAAQNLIFDQSADDPFFTGSIRYDDPVRCARPDLRLVDAEGRDVAPLVLLDVANPPEPLRAQSLREAVGRAIARSIRDLLDATPLFVADDARDTASTSADVSDSDAAGERRRLRARDVMILTRTNWEAEKLAEYLREADVPFAFFKRDGLFQSEEAREVRDLLVGIAHPDKQRTRLRAWYTPFFGVPLGELHRCRDLPDTHPLISRLYAWHAIARTQRYEQLFARIVTDSGLLRREIFYADNERKLTNVLHIFEILLDASSRARGTLEALIARLDAFIAGHEQPPGIDGNVQRLESERAAVQVMTIHKAKGLEAAVVYLFGGFTRPRQQGPWIYHVPTESDAGGDQAGLPFEPEDDTTEGDEEPALERIIGLERPADPELRAVLEREAREEEQRLLYVATTRACTRLVLPFYRLEDINERGRSYFLDSTYEPLRRRLELLLRTSPTASVTLVRQDDDGEPRLTRMPETSFDALVDVIESGRAGLHHASGEGDEAPLESWHPPAELLALPSQSGPPPSLRERRLTVTSYSRMRDDTHHTDLLEAPAPPEVSLPDDAVPGGAASGSFIHDVLENVPFDSVVAALSHDAPVTRWIAMPEVARVFDECLLRHGIDARYRASAEKIVFAGLSTPIVLHDGERLDGIARCAAHTAELEFVYPLPERWHPTLDAIDAERRPRLEVERGWVRGFIDLVFEFDGRVYFLDWKSDVMTSYAPSSLRQHVHEHYQWQARLYSLAVVKMLQAHDSARFEERFGGLVYCFVRGMGREEPAGSGVYFARPEFDDVCRFESLLAAQPV